MIQYTEKGPGLHEAIAAAGHWLRQHGDDWEASDETAVQAIIDSFDPLPAAKAARWELVKEERERRKAAGYLAAGHRFHSDSDSRIQQLGLMMMGASVPAVPWRTLGGEYVTMSQAIAGAIFAATASADMRLFAAAEAHRAAINALADLNAITGYDFSGGWPAV